MEENAAIRRVFHEDLRVDVWKNSSHKEGVRKRGPSIWLILTYMVVFHADSRGATRFS